jgi:hypothetical protein
VLGIAHQADAFSTDSEDESDDKDPWIETHWKIWCRYRSKSWWVLSFSHVFHRKHCVLGTPRNTIFG